MLTRESLGVNGGSNHVDTEVAGVRGGQIMLARESLGVRPPNHLDHRLLAL